MKEINNTMWNVVNVKKRNGRLVSFDASKINEKAERVCRGLSGVNPSELVLSANLQFTDKIKTSDIDTVLCLSAQNLAANSEPNYVFVAGRILLESLYKEIFKEGVDSVSFEYQYRKSFATGLKKLVAIGKVNEKLLTVFDLKKLSNALNIDADSRYNYLGVSTIREKYLLRDLEDNVVETPQGWLMRVAMGLALKEDNPTERAIEFYELYSQGRLMSSTPTLFNSGTSHPQLSSCYLFDMDDSSKGIMSTMAQLAELSKFSGGLGGSINSLRATGSYIKSTAGHSSGPIPFAKIVDSTIVAFNQGGRRAGVCVLHMEPWHLDIQSFIRLRENAGDERIRTHDINTALWIPDEFMRRVEDKEATWTLLDPGECPDLHNLYGKDFEEKYLEYEKLAQEGNLKNFKIVNARDLWKDILTFLFQTGHPWISFKDPSNERYSNKHKGMVHSSNLCQEIILRTKSSDKILGEDDSLIAVCNLASINLMEHVEDGVIQYSKLKQTIKTAIRMLDNVIDNGYYPVEAARRFNEQDRAIGLGMMGWADLCLSLGFNPDDERAIELADELTEGISYYAIQASSDLAAERGKYPTYEGSEWSQGNLPIDLYIESQKRRGLEYNDVKRLDWDSLRAKILKDGMRNSNVMAIAPTATIANIMGVSASTEPLIRNIYAKSNQNGTYFEYVPATVEFLKSKGLWTKEMLSYLIRTKGDLDGLEMLTEEEKARFRIAFKANSSNIIKAQARRMKWIDQSASFNQYVSANKLKAIEQMYLECWKLGLKTTYYLKGQATTKTDMLTGTNLNIETTRVELSEDAELKACSIDNPDCEACQ